MSKVLVTGGAGFIGAHLVARLVGGGSDVVVVDNMKRGSKAKLAALRGPGSVTVVEGDIRNFDTLREVAAGCDTVFHLAAQSNVMGAVDDPDYSITTNVLGTFNVLRSAAEAGARRVVFTSSREVYGDPQSLPVGEGHPWLAKNPYGASKAAGEAYCRTFVNTHGLSVQVLRLANVYGPGDSGRVIPLWLAAAQEGRDLQVYGGE
ncbi:MAG: NAD-dependent epimerase/dehydratase family protein, partial [Polyangiaceae bacterium]